MRRTWIALGVSVLTLSTVAAQSPAPAFDAAEVRLRPYASTFDPRMMGVIGGQVRNGRYDLRNATMLDLISTGYGVESDSVIGGPSWLEWTRFDIAAKVPDATPPATLGAMLKTLLADRFKLAVRADTRPMPGFILATGSGKHKMKEASGDGPAGCRSVPQPLEPGGMPTAVATCRNMTMDDFARRLGAMAGAYITSPVANKTGLSGAYDFELKWNARSALPQAGAISLFDAVDEQLGLKLARGTIDAPVLVVDRVNEQPSPNPPGIAQAIPAPPPATFEVATMKLTGPDVDRQRTRVLPGGRVEWEAVTLKMLMSTAWNIDDDQLFVNVPSWFATTRYSVQALAPALAAGTGASMRVYFDELQPMLQTLLFERLKLKTHIEKRDVSGYTLVADKPRMQKANPADRTRCVDGPAPNSADPRDKNPILARLVRCQNVTMAQFADRLQGIAPGYIRLPVFDGTGLDGSYNFTLTFSPSGSMQQTAGANANQPSAVPVASDPTGALSLPEALDRQLGLKLKLEKRRADVVVIDHVEQQPVN